MHGYALGEVLGKKFHRFIADEDRERVQALFRDKLKDTADALIFEYGRMTRDGRCLPTEMTVKNTRYEAVLSTIGICRDINRADPDGGKSAGGGADGLHRAAHRQFVP